MITVVGSLNTDLFIETARLPSPGETVVGSSFRRACGGKGANQACAIARLGHPEALIGAVGCDPFGDELLANLSAEGVRLDGVWRAPDVASGVAMIVVDASGQNQIVVSAGANDTVSAELVRTHRGAVEQSGAVVAQLEIPLAATRAALELGRELGKLTVLNPAPLCAMDDSLLQLCDVLVANEHEAAGLSGLRVEDQASAAAAAQRIRSRSMGNVIVTLGANGAWLDTQDFAGHLPGFAVAAVDTVGAGDAFIGALVVRLLEGAPYQEAALFAQAAAALSVTRHGAQAGLPRRAEVDAWLARQG